MASLLPILLCLLGQLFVVNAGQQTVVSDLRSSTVAGTVGRFLVYRDDGLKILKERAPGLKLASDVHDREYDTELYTEIMLAAVNLTDLTLSAEMNEPTSDVSAGGQALFVLLPVISGGDVMDLILALYTDETKPLLIPYDTNYEAVIKVDSIALCSTGNTDMIKIQDGDDQIVMLVEHTAYCKDTADLGHDFDEETGPDIRFSNYPNNFDWGCELHSFSFCDKLKTTLRDADFDPSDGNVCTTMTTPRSRRCPVVSIDIYKITGRFLRELPTVVGTVPISAIEGEYIDRVHNNGIIFPCIVN